MPFHPSVREPCQRSDASPSLSPASSFTVMSKAEALLTKMEEGREEGEREGMKRVRGRTLKYLNTQLHWSKT